MYRIINYTIPTNEQNNFFLKRNRTFIIILFEETEIKLYRYVILYNFEH